MKPIDAVTQTLRKFPESWHVIVRLAHEDNDFREQCEHLAECESTLERMREEGRDIKWIEEYQALIKDLEQEIKSSVARNVCDLREQSTSNQES